MSLKNIGGIRDYARSSVYGKKREPNWEATQSCKRVGRYETHMYMYMYVYVYMYIMESTRNGEMSQPGGKA